MEIFGKHMPEFVVFVCRYAQVDNGFPQPRGGELCARQDLDRTHPGIVSPTDRLDRDESGGLAPSRKRIRTTWIPDPCHGHAWAVR